MMLTEPAAAFRIAKYFLGEAWMPAVLTSFPTLDRAFPGSENSPRGLMQAKASCAENPRTP
jgi:hypothetical protein